MLKEQLELQVPPHLEQAISWRSPAAASSTSSVTSYVKTKSYDCSALEAVRCAIAFPFIGLTGESPNVLPKARNRVNCGANTVPIRTYAARGIRRRAAGAFMTASFVSRQSVIDPNISSIGVKPM